MTDKRSADLILFSAVAYGASWLVALPLWLGHGLASPQFETMAGIMMFTPALGVVAVWLKRRTNVREWGVQTGLRIGPRRGRTATLAAAAWIGTPLLIALALGISVAANLLRLDLTGLSLFREILLQGGTPPPSDLRAPAITQLVTAVLIGPVLNAVPALGEEWAWRGWLLPALADSYSPRLALLLSGLAWGIWHSPRDAPRLQLPHPRTMGGRVLHWFLYPRWPHPRLAAPPFRKRLASCRRPRRHECIRSRDPATW